MTIISRRTSLMAMVLSLSSLSFPLIAADVAYPTAITAADTVTVGGTAPGAFTTPTNTTKIGGGMIRTIGTTAAPAAVGTNEVAIGKGVVSAKTNMYVNGRPVAVKTVDNAFTVTQTIAGTAPGALTLPADAGKVKIGGGVIRAGKSVVVGTDPSTTSGSLLRVGGNLSLESISAIYAGADSAATLRAYFNSSISWWRAPSGGHVWQNSTGANRMTLSEVGALVLGTDPGGSELLRVGGAINATSFNLQIGGTSGYWNGPNMYGPNAGNFTIRSGNSASSLRLGGNNNSDHVVISSTGNVGIGTTTPTGKLSVNGNADVSGYLSVNRATANGTLSTNALSVNRITGTTQSVTSYDKAIYGSLIDYAIPSGAVDSGYKIGVDASGYSGTSGFQGTLHQSYGVWARAGIHQSGASARTLAAYGVYAELLSNAGTINDGFGVYIKTDGYSAGVVTNRYDLYAASPTAKNYFAGKVGIGITDPQNALSVAGTISAKEIKVTTTGADYVFDDTYRLRPLTEVEQFIKDNRHLPEIPSAKVMQQDGMGVSEIVTKQLAKIEELTLYAIQAERERDAQADRLATLEQQVATMAAANAHLMEQMQLLLKQTAIKNP